MVQRHRVAARVAHDPLGLARRAGGVEDVERVGRFHRHAGVRLGGGLGFQQVAVAPGREVAGPLRPLQDQARLGLVRRQGDGGVEQRLVGNHAARLQPAGGGDHHLRPGIGDARRQLRRREAAEHHGMHGAQARAGEHGDRRFRHHRHVDHHPVAAADAERRQRAGELGGALRHRRVGEGPDLPGHRAVVDQRRLPAAAGGDVAVERIVAGVQPPAREPAAVDAERGVEGANRGAVPVDAARRFRPVGGGVAAPRRVDLVVALAAPHGAFLPSRSVAGSRRRRKPRRKRRRGSLPGALRAAAPPSGRRGVRSARAPWPGGRPGRARRRRRRRCRGPWSRERRSTR